MTYGWTNLKRSFQSTDGNEMVKAVNVNRYYLAIFLLETGSLKESELCNLILIIFCVGSLELGIPLSQLYKCWVQASTTTWVRFVNYRCILVTSCHDVIFIGPALNSRMLTHLGITYWYFHMSRHILYHSSFYSSVSLRLALCWLSVNSFYIFCS